MAFIRPGPSVVEADEYVAGQQGRGQIADRKQRCGQSRTINGGSTKRDRRLVRFNQAGEGRMAHHHSGKYASNAVGGRGHLDRKLADGIRLDAPLEAADRVDLDEIFHQPRPGARRVDLEIRIEPMEIQAGAVRVERREKGAQPFEAGMGENTLAVPLHQPMNAGNLFRAAGKHVGRTAARAVFQPAEIVRTAAGMDDRGCNRSYRHGKTGSCPRRQFTDEQLDVRKRCLPHHQRLSMSRLDEDAPISQRLHLPQYQHDTRGSKMTK